MRSVELFSGAGGLALGISRAGFEHAAVVEWDKSACKTLRENQARRVELMAEWPVHECDVRNFDYDSIRDQVDLLAGGVPCQPFSIGGKHKGYQDERNMFPVMVSAIRRLRPKAVLIENVRGLGRQSFSKYFGYIELMLTYPEILRKSGEGWLDHLARLERHHTKGKMSGLSYKVVHRMLNAADYGLPQKRERLFIVGMRSDLGVEWSFPAPTHCAEALLWDQFRSGDYWARHGINPLNPTTSMAQQVEALSQFLLPPSGRPWRTVRDAISDLPEPARARSANEPGLNHFVVQGARSYPGHTGSPLDQPAKTLKAGVHGVPGGENMLALPNGRVRYFTIRESARLQSFPDAFVFPDSWTESMRQIGNAVPVDVAELLAKRLASVLHQKDSCLSSTTSRLISSPPLRTN